MRLSLQLGDGVANLNPFVLAANYTASGNFMAGEFGEVLLYDRRLSEGEILGVESYLGRKYFDRSPGVGLTSLSLPSEALVIGENTLSVSLHSPAWVSVDKAFDMALTGFVPGFLLHTNYGISSSGEEIILSLPDGTLVDELAPTVLPRDISIGRVEGEGDAWFFFDAPTPGAANTSTAYLGILEPPTFSHAGGFFTEGFDLHLSHSDPEVTIVYTADGSSPSVDNLAGTTYVYKNQFPRNPGEPFGEFLEHTFFQPSL